MKKFILFVSSISLFTSVLGQITFQKRYGGADNDFGVCVRETADSGYVITGNSYSFGGSNTNSNVYLVKSDRYGSLLWAKTYDCGGFFQAGSSVIQTSDGGFVISGYKYSIGTSESPKILLIKTFANGAIDWTKSFPGGDYISSVQQTSDGGYVVASTTNVNSAGNSDFLLIKIDSSGAQQWTKTYGGAADDIAYSIVETNDNGFLACGYSLSFSSNYDTYVIKTFSNGDLEWSKSYSQTYGVKNYVSRTNDGGYLIASEGAKLIKIDSLGNLLWSKAYSGGINISSIQSTSDHGMVFSGQKNGHAYLLKTDSNCVAQFERTFGDTATGMFAQQTVDGGYILSGFIYGLGAQISDVYLVKTDGSGRSGCYESAQNTTYSTPSVTTINPVTQVQNASSDTTFAVITRVGGNQFDLCLYTGIAHLEDDNIFAIYPNPSTGKFSIEIPLLDRNGKLFVCDVLGNCIINKPIHDSSFEVDLTGLPKGVYTIEVNSTEKRLRKKVVLN